MACEDTKVRSLKYLNNLIEQDHQNIKSRTNVMLGFKRFRNAATTISGIELMHRIRKGQFGLPALALEDVAAPCGRSSGRPTRFRVAPEAGTQRRHEDKFFLSRVDKHIF
jgi:hypothetical protein